MWVDLCRGNKNSFDDGNRTFTVEAAAAHTGSEVQNPTEQSWEDQSKMCKTMATDEINLQLREMVPIQFVFTCFAAEKVRHQNKFHKGCYPPSSPAELDHQQIPPSVLAHVSYL
jgi:hypothetical protein